MYEVCKITFTSKPKDYEVYEYLMLHWYDLRFIKMEGNKRVEIKSINPKRLQKLIKKQVALKPKVYKAHQAMKLQQEQAKLQKKHQRKEQREVRKQAKFELHKQKQKKKHRGR